MNVSQELVDILTQCDTANMKQIMLQTMVVEPDNKWGTAVQEFGKATAFACVAEKHDPDYQRVLGLTEEDIEHLPAIRNFFVERGIRGSPETPPGLFTPELGKALVAADFLPHVMGCNYWSEVDKLDIKSRPDVEVRRVETLEDLRIHLKVSIAGWEDPQSDEDEEWLGHQKWLSVDGWHVFLAYVDGQPAGQAVLSMHGDIGYFAQACTHPDYRRRGCQSALMHARGAMARDLGAKIVWSQTDFNSQSGMNMQRFGLKLAYTYMCWALREDVLEDAKND